MKYKKNQVACPHCGQFKIEPRYAKYGAIGMGLMIVGGIFSIILIGIPFFFLGIGIMIYGVARVKGSRCRTCGFEFGM